MRVEQQSDGTLARVLDPVEINLFARILRLQTDIARLSVEEKKRNSELSDRLARTEAELFLVKQRVGPHLGRFLTSSDLIRAQGQMKPDPSTSRHVLEAGAAGVIAHTQNLGLIPGEWTALAYVRGPATLRARAGALDLGQTSDGGSGWRTIYLTFRTTSPAELFIDAQAAGSALDYVAVRMEGAGHGTP